MRSAISACRSLSAIRRSSDCSARTTMTDATQTYEGGCHCGRVRFRVTADLSRVTECNCSICTKKGFLHLIVAPDDFEPVKRQGRADHLPLQYRHRAAHLLRRLRHSSVPMCRAPI